MAENQPGAESSDNETTENPGGDQSGGQSDEQELDDSWLSKQDPATQAYVKKLRKEAAQHRKQSQTLKNNLETMNERFQNFEGGLKRALGLSEDGGDEEVDPQSHIQQLQMQGEQAMIRAAVLESALENGIAHDQVGYYEYLLQQRAGALEEGEELSEDDYAEIISKVKQVGNANTSGQATSVSHRPADPVSNKDGVSLEQFVGMTVGQKSELYQKNPPLYQQLMSEARSKRRI